MLLGILIPSANLDGFSQKLDFFNSEDQICSVLVLCKSRPRRGYQGRSASLEVIVLQSRRESAVSIKLHRNSQVTRLQLRFVPDRMTSGD